MIISDVLRGIERCPQCNCAEPTLTQLWKEENIRTPQDPERSGRTWATYRCSYCADLVLVGSEIGSHEAQQKVADVYPETVGVHEDIPEHARNYLKQAIESVHAPDGAAMLAGSAVDAMLKEKGLEEGSIYERIDTAVDKNILTKDMGEWAHSVRLGSNRPRHADKDEPHVSEQEAKQSIEFAKTLGQILFVLPARIERGREAGGDDEDTAS